jgi:hypothetical protein
MTTKKATTDEAKVQGVAMAKVQEARAREAFTACIAAAKVDGVTPVVIKRMPIENVVSGMVRWYADIANCPRAKQVECQACGGISDADLESCPYCGDGAEEDPPAESKAAAVTGGKHAKPAVEPDEDATTLEAATAAGKAKKGAKAELVTAEPHVDLAAHAGIVGEKEPATEGLLDRVVKRVSEMKANLAVHYWTLGKQLTVVFDRELWKMRKSSDGKPVYTTFPQWCEKELGTKAGSFYPLMDAARVYSEAQARKLGMTKLGQIVTAPKDAQAKILAMAEKGASTRQIAQKVKEERAKANLQRRDTGRGKGGVGKPGKLSAAEKAKGVTKADVNPAGRITVAVAEGRSTLELFAKPAKKGAESKRAKTLADEPYAKEELTNGVVRLYSVVKRASGLVLVVKTVRA